MDTLPDELVYEILTQVPYRESWLNVLLTCKRFYGLAYNNYYKLYTEKERPFFLYTIGGLSDTCEVRYIERFDVKHNNWTVVSTLTNDIECTATVGILNNIYAIGGCNVAGKFIINFYSYELWS